MSATAARIVASWLSLALLVAAPPPTRAGGGRNGEWVRLAKVRLNLLEKGETLDVNSDRAVRKIRLQVENVGVVLEDVSIHFEDGEAHEVKLLTGYVAAGGQTHAVEIEGRPRVIDEVRIGARTRARALGTAGIELWGLP